MKLHKFLVQVTDPTECHDAEKLRLFIAGELGARIGGATVTHEESPTGDAPPTLAQVYAGKPHISWATKAQVAKDLPLDARICALDPQQLHDFSRNLTEQFGARLHRVEGGERTAFILEMADYWRAGLDSHRTVGGIWGDAWGYYDRRRRLKAPSAPKPAMRIIPV